MTRETRIGMGVATLFLGLLGVVVASKWPLLRGTGADKAEPKSELVAQTNEPPTAPNPLPNLVQKTGLIEEKGINGAPNPFPSDPNPPPPPQPEFPTTSNPPTQIPFPEQNKDTLPDLNKLQPPQPISSSQQNDLNTPPPIAPIPSAQEERKDLTPLPQNNDPNPPQPIPVPVPITEPKVPLPTDPLIPMPITPAETKQDPQPSPPPVQALPPITNSLPPVITPARDPAPTPLPPITNEIAPPMPPARDPLQIEPTRPNPIPVPQDPPSITINKEPMPQNPPLGANTNTMDLPKTQPIIRPNISDPLPTIGTPMTELPSITAPATGQLPEVKRYQLRYEECLPGETSFVALSRRLYGDDRHASALLEWNRSFAAMDRRIQQDPPMLQPGMRIQVPPREMLENRQASLQRNNNATGVSISRPLPISNPGLPANLQPPTADRTRTYRVPVEGKTILELARDTLGDGNRWPEIYRLNPRIQPQNPIPAGTELRLPIQANVP